MLISGVLERTYFKNVAMDTREPSLFSNPLVVIQSRVLVTVLSHSHHQQLKPNLGASVFSVGILRIVTFVNLLVTLYIALSESIVAIAFP